MYNPVPSNLYSIQLWMSSLQLKKMKAHVSAEVNETAFSSPHVPQWGAADAEIKVPSGENTELKRSFFSLE